MTSCLQLSSAALFEDDSAREAVTALLAQALTKEEAVRLSLAKDGGTLSCESADRKAPVQLFGRWRVPQGAPAASNGAGASLLLPLLFYVREIRLAPSEIVTLGHADLPVADLFARNLLCSFSRSSMIGLEQGKWFRPDMSRVFAERYLALLSDNLTEPVFTGARPSECMDLALAALSLGKPVLENPLLLVGAQQLHEDAERTALRRNFSTARAEVLKVVAP